MTSKEIFDRVGEVIKRKNLITEEISVGLGYNYDTLNKCIKRGSSRIYLAMDILDAVGLELQLDNITVNSHQEFIDYVNARNPVNLRISKSTGISQGMIQRLKEGDNVSFDKAVRILDALGIEVRVV